MANADDRLLDYCIETVFGDGTKETLNVPRATFQNATDRYASEVKAALLENRVSTCGITGVFLRGERNTLLASMSIYDLSRQ